MAFEREAAIGNLEYAKRWKDRPTDETIDMAIKALKQEPKLIVKSDGTIEQIKNCDDCIFRKEWEKIGKLLSVILKKQTEQEPCEDAISRQAALKELKESAEHHANDCREEALLRRDRDIIRALPPITPQPKTGHWIRMKAYEKWRCSECDTVFRFTFKEHDYCPKCGAKMIEPQESEEQE